MVFTISYASLNLIQSFHAAVDEVAHELIYLQMIEAPELEKLYKFQKKLIENNWPSFFALVDNEVVGWIDISPIANPRLAHRGVLGMGVRKNFRGQGIGKKLMELALTHSKKAGLEKIELNVYTSNTVAIELYKKFGFQQSGFISHFRKLNGEYFDCLFMDLHL